MKRAIIIIAVFAQSALAAAESVEDCTKIGDPQERLGCYDRQFSRSSGVEADEATEKVAATAGAAGAQETTDSDDEQLPVPATAPMVTSQQEAASSPETASKEKDAPKAGLFDQDERVDLASTITHVHSKPQQKMVFQLENDQVWMQSAPRMLQIREGDRVTIENASIGGYMMRTERGVTTRVERVR